MKSFFSRLWGDMRVAYDATPSPIYNKYVSVTKLLWWHAILKRIRPVFIGDWLGFRFFYQSNTDGAASSYYMPYIEYPLYYIIHHFPSKRGIFFDVGANIGNYSLMAAGKGYLVHSFEPNEEVLRIAKINSLLNAVEHTISFHSCALGEKKGKKDFFLSAISTSGCSSFSSKRGGKKQQIEVETLDAYCHKEHIEHIDVIKIDVEGSEFEVLAGAKKMLSKKSISTIFWETESEKGIKKQQKIFSLLNKHGFTHYHFDPEKNRIEPWDGQWNCFSILKEKQRIILKTLLKA